MNYAAMVRIMLHGFVNQHQRLTLLFLTLSLLLFSNGNQSLLAHDEGYYATQARWILETQDWLTPQWWGTPVYDRTIGIQWLIALASQFFGINEFSVRLPTIIACTISVLLTYEIGKILLNRQVAWIGAIILCLMGIWISESRMGNQNIALVCIELIGIWALLSAEQLEYNQKKQRFFWGILAGTTIGLGFLIKGFMIVLPIVAIAPYILLKNRDHRHLSNLGIYIGLVIGIIPVVAWLGLSCLKYGGLSPVQDLFGKLLFLSSNDTYNPGLLYYFWNIPLNTFPWALFSIIGAVSVWHKSPKLINYSGKIVVLGYPIILFLLLNLFRTRTPYYPLQLLPFMALLAGVAFDDFEDIYRARKYNLHQLISWLFYAFTGLGILLVIIGSLINLNFDLFGINKITNIKTYGIIGIILGSGWSTISITWKNRQVLPAKSWLASWLISPWLTIAALGLIGAWGDRTSEFRISIQQPAIAQIIADHPINFVVETPPDTQQN
jgi:4-amino-4-deoxy-L-arabinose transferase-like glycosyltransferase